MSRRICTIPGCVDKPRDGARRCEQHATTIPPQVERHQGKTWCTPCHMWTPSILHKPWPRAQVTS